MRRGPGVSTPVSVGLEVSGASHGSLNLDIGPLPALCATAWEGGRFAAASWGGRALVAPGGSRLHTVSGGVLSACWLSAWLAVCTLGPVAIVRCSWDPALLLDDVDPRCSSGPETLHRVLVWSWDLAPSTWWSVNPRVAWALSPVAQVLRVLVRCRAHRPNSLVRVFFFLVGPEGRSPRKTQERESAPRRGRLVACCYLPTLPLV